MIEASQSMIMINRQGEEQRAIDHAIEICKIRKKCIRTTPKDTDELEPLSKAKNKTHLRYI
jgi:hypothetical protein